MEQTFCVGTDAVESWQSKGSILFAATIRHSLNYTKENQTPWLGWSSKSSNKSLFLSMPTLATGMSVVTSASLLKVSPKWREQDSLSELVNIVLLLLLSVG